MDRLPLRYTRPADEWVQALPIGIGRLGAMVFGGIASERLQLNEDTFFSGGPYDPGQSRRARGVAEGPRAGFRGPIRRGADADRRVGHGPAVRQMSYQTIGDLLLTFPGIENASGYLRELHLSDGDRPHAVRL